MPLRYYSLAMSSQSEPTNHYAKVFANRRIAAMLMLGFASGLPLALRSVDHTSLINSQESLW